MESGAGQKVLWESTPVGNLRVRSTLKQVSVLCKELYPRIRSFRPQHTKLWASRRGSGPISVPLPAIRSSKLRGSQRWCCSRFRAPQVEVNHRVDYLDPFLKLITIEQAKSRQKVYFLTWLSERELYRKIHSHSPAPLFACEKWCWATLKLNVQRCTAFLVGM